jgi:hypothetical protein
MVAVFNIDDSFLMPDGARLVGRDGDTVRFEVSMPVDEQGFSAASVRTAG